MMAITKESAVGQIFNIATGERATLNDLLKILCDIGDKDFSPEYYEARVGNIKDSYANVHKANKLMEFSSKVEIRDGLKSLFYN